MRIAVETIVAAPIADVWRAYTTRDTDQYLKIVYLNDSLERIRSAIAGEVISWGGL